MTIFKTTTILCGKLRHIKEAEPAEKEKEREGWGGVESYLGSMPLKPEQTQRRQQEGGPQWPNKRSSGSRRNVKGSIREAKCSAYVDKCHLWRDVWSFFRRWSKDVFVFYFRGSFSNIQLRFQTYDNGLAVAYLRLNNRFKNSIKRAIQGTHFPMPALHTVERHLPQGIHQQCKYQSNIMLYPILPVVWIFTV